MNLMEATLDIIRQVAEEKSEGGKIDSHWKAVLPEIQDIFANEIFLAQHRWYIKEPMKYRAAEIAQETPLRDVGNLDDATLTLHYWLREALLGAGDDQKFQALIDQSHGVIYNTVAPIRWVKPSVIWLPYTDVIAKQIYRSLIERYKQSCFAQHCRAELTYRIQSNEVKTHMFILLAPFAEFSIQQKKAYQWLRDKSRGIASDVGEDAMHDWLEKLSGLPPHIRTQKIGATLKAISQRAIDIQQKGGKYKHIPLEEELVDTVPDESAKAPNEGIIDEEFFQLLLAKQKKVEEILSRDSPKKRRSKIGKRRFKVLQMLIDTSTIAATEIAKKFETSDQTIGRDKKAIEQSLPLITKVIYS